MSATKFSNEGTIIGEDTVMTKIDVEKGGASEEEVKEDTRQEEREEKTDRGPKKDMVAAAAAMTYPDGGLQAWLTVIGAWLVLFSTFGYVNAFGVYQDYYTRIYLTNKTASDISWIGSVQIFFLFAFGFPAGLLFDLGYYKHITIFGTLLLSFSNFMLSLAHEHEYYQIFLSQGVGAGAAMGLLFLPSMILISHYFKRRRALAMGLAVSGSSCGGIVFPIMLNKLFQNPHVGFNWAVRAVSFVILGCLFIACVSAKTRLPNRKERERMGIKNEKPDFVGILTRPAWALTVTGAFLIGWGIYFPFFYLQLFAVTHNISSNLSFYSLAILNAASVFGRTLPNFVADSYGPYNVLIACTTMSGVLVFALFGATNPGGVVAFSILFGFSSGAYVSIMGPTLISIARSMAEIGVISGFAFLFISVACLTGTPISGALLGSVEANYTWSRAIVFSGVMVMAGTAFMFAARFIVAKQKGTQLV